MEESLNNKEIQKNIENPIEKELSLPEKVEKLEKENEELKNKLENMKKLFRILGHDLITPIGNNAAFIDLLSESVKNDSMGEEELADNLDVISRSSKSAHKLLEDLLRWSRLQQEGIKPEISAVDLANQVEDSIAPLLLIAKEKGVNLKNEIPNDVDILADSNMLRTVIRNLSSNAIKFTKRGGNVSISCEKKNNLVEIYIKDNGVGLAEDQIKKLFESTGVSKDGTSGEKGTGFGLSISKEMIDIMNGTIHVESKGEGKGTTFTITLPEGKKEIAG